MPSVVKTIGCGSTTNDGDIEHLRDPTSADVSSDEWYIPDERSPWTSLDHTYVGPFDVATCYT